ncbi:hypothetical protein GCM10027589_59900 [Actinocorallia lasiicapitis]
MALARALATGPDLLLLDEPTTALDTASREAFVALLRRLRAETGLACLLISHDPSLLAQLADRTVRLADGRLTPAEVS